MGLAIKTVSSIKRLIDVEDIKDTIKIFLMFDYKITIYLYYVAQITSKMENFTSVLAELVVKN